MQDAVVMEAVSRGNPVVFFDVTIGGVPSGRIRMELFKDAVYVATFNCHDLRKP